MANALKLENYEVGKMISARSARVSAEETKRPPYYTEAALLEDMCNAHKFATNEEERAQLKETNGIGTARTRGEVIKDLLRSDYIARSGKGKSTVLKDTATGRHLNSIAPPVLKSVAMTAKWELSLTQVARGIVTKERFIKVLESFVTALVQQVRNDKEKSVAK